MPVVADTSPLSYLILIGEVEVLPHFYEEISMPPAVSEELRHPDGPGRTQRWIEDPPTWLQVENPPGQGSREVGSETQSMLHSLERGERHAIRLARSKEDSSQGKSLLVIDERDGRLIAMDLGLPITGTLGTLDEAASEELVDAERVAAQLKETSFRASEELYRWLIGRHS